MHADPQHLALRWLHATYHGLVELAVPHPVAEDALTWLFACRTVEQPGCPRTPMLAASLVVPKDGGVPFHPAANDPWGDAAAYTNAPAPRDPATQARRLNSRGCVVSVAAALAGATATPLPWQPAHEAPGWWELLLRRYFPSAEQLRCATWDEVITRMRGTGPGTQGVVWVRRTVGGVEASGHLLYAHNKDGQVVFLDGMTGGLARLDTAGVLELVLARLRPPAAPAPVAPDPYRGEAHDFGAAVEKARDWLRRTYREPVVLVDPSAEDETERGWLFAVNTEAFAGTGDWRHGMLDAALVVPKAAAEPFGLPNSSPWAWLEAWNRGGEPGTDGLTLPPEPGPAAWLGPTLGELGATAVSVSEHTEWGSLLDELSAMEVGARALIWARRTDRRGRESVGLVLTGFRSEQGIGVMDSSAAPVTDLTDVAAARFHLIRYR
ncbi:YrhB domain-containing protein [Streptomyces sp. NPDC059909]|uniref:YrhB domain-containing protein n=1 Tax=Streptomyces sp. NPDC059909 TaxID=3346998 RepID=UPI003669112F